MILIFEFAVQALQPMQFRVQCRDLCINTGAHKSLRYHITINHGRVTLAGEGSGKKRIEIQQAISYDHVSIGKVFWPRRWTHAGHVRVHTRVICFYWCSFDVNP